MFLNFIKLYYLEMEFDFMMKLRLIFYLLYGLLNIFERDFFKLVVFWYLYNWYI